VIAILDEWLALAARLARRAVWAGGALILASAFLIGVEVVLRKLFLVSIGGADELSGYAFAIGTSWSLSFTLLERANVRVDALYSRLGARLRAACDVLGLASLAAFVGLLGWHAVQVLATSLEFSSRATTPLATPLWIPQGLWLAGFGLFLFSLTPLLLRTLGALIVGDLATVRRLAGARTIGEDAAAEISHAAHGSVQADAANP
jgi:TRAP-type mannitol/chloroaromatic compound transport system permease small subunit